MCNGPRRRYDGPNGSTTEPARLAVFVANTDGTVLTIDAKMTSTGRNEASDFGEIAMAQPDEWPEKNPTLVETLLTAARMRRSSDNLTASDST